MWRVAADGSALARHREVLPHQLAGGTLHRGGFR